MWGHTGRSNADWALAGGIAAVLFTPGVLAGGLDSDAIAESWRGLAMVSTIAVLALGAIGLILLFRKSAAHWALRWIPALLMTWAAGSAFGLVGVPLLVDSEHGSALAGVCSCVSGLGLLALAGEIARKPQVGM